MASSSGTLVFHSHVSYSSGENCRAKPVGCCWHAAHANANRIVDSVENCGCSRNYGLLADTLGTERANWRRILDQDRFNRRHIANRGNQIVVKVLTLAGKEFFHQRHAQSLGSAALDLPFDQGWIDGTAHVMGGGNLQDLHCAQFRIDRNLRQVRPESEYGVWNALTIFIERAGGRIEGGTAGDHVAMLVEWQGSQADDALLPV